MLYQMFAGISEYDMRSLTHDGNTRETTMVTQTGDICCQVKDCGRMAVAVCEHCGHPCCLAHVRHVSITCRADRRPPGMSASARLPIRTETYTLCLRCSTKPVPRRTHVPAL